jgi:hypothetical protein
LSIMMGTRGPGQQDQDRRRRHASHVAALYGKKYPVLGHGMGLGSFVIHPSSHLPAWRAWPLSSLPNEKCSHSLGQLFVHETDPGRACRPGTRHVAHPRSADQVSPVGCCAGPGRAKRAAGISVHDTGQ